MIFIFIFIFPLYGVYVYTQLCWTLCDPVDWSPPGPSIHRIFYERGVGPLYFSRGSSPPRDWTCISCIGSLLRWETDSLPLVPPALNITEFQLSLKGFKARRQRKWMGHSREEDVAACKTVLDNSAWVPAPGRAMRLRDGGTLFLQG